MKKIKITLALMLVSSICLSQNLNHLQTKERKQESLVFLAYSVAFSGVNTYFMYKNEQFPRPAFVINLAIPISALTYVGITHKNELKAIKPRIKNLFNGK